MLTARYFQRCRPYFENPEITKGFSFSFFKGVNTFHSVYKIWKSFCVVKVLLKVIETTAKVLLKVIDSNRQLNPETVFPIYQVKIV